MSDAERKTLADLEWDQVEQAVADRCQGPLAEGLSLHLAESFEETERMLAEAREARTLLDRNDPLPLDGICEIASSLQHLEREGVLDASALKDIRVTLRAAAALRRFLAQRKDSLPYLHRACAIDPTLDGLAAEVGMSIGDDGTLLDSASAELARLREEVGNLRRRIVRKLEDLIQKRSAILQDSFYTIREGRYVLPVRTDAHERFHGIVHGSSASGATIFVEPRELVDRGNRLKMAQGELEREERRILAALSELVRQYVPQIRAAAEALDHADLRGASAQLAVDLGAQFVELCQEPRITLRGARHPSLVLAGVEVVPNDIELSGGEALVISGPNAGGKTVALKMLGLAALMTRAGLAVPVDEGSACGFFSPVLAAVGDEQSLARSLSTFSAHLVTLRGVLEQADERVLVLLDELAGATDPEAGAALACAIVKTLVERGSAVAVTTHYEALKALAAEREEMHNASVGFDFDTMSPTFRMTMGVPGGSNALEVARRYGIPAEVIDQARSALPEHSRNFETLVAKLDAATKATLNEQSALEEDRIRINQERAKLDLRGQELKAREAKGLGRESQKLVDQVRELHARLDHAKKELRQRSEAESVEAASNALREGAELLGELDAHRLSLEPEPVETSALDPTAVRVGDRVWVERLRSPADVIAGPARGKVRVSAGMMKLWVDVTDLRALKEVSIAPVRESSAASAAHSRPQRALRTSDNTLDVRGLRADDAVALAEAFLDRMYGAAESSVFIVHGVGSGALRVAIHEHLARDAAYVEGFRQATRDEGGPQVTVVSLK
ncbi:MAG: endonuclease MutS2 [Deltaproteobacteria bacterium]|nr:endonuclease MutS2 [Deltaproteobacteria bacterium]